MAQWQAVSAEKFFRLLIAFVDRNERQRVHFLSDEIVKPTLVISAVSQKDATFFLTVDPAQLPEQHSRHSRIVDVVRLGDFDQWNTFGGNQNMGAIAPEKGEFLFTAGRLFEVGIVSESGGGIAFDLLGFVETAAGIFGVVMFGVGHDRLGIGNQNIERNSLGVQQKFYGGMMNLFEFGVVGF